MKISWKHYTTYCLIAFLCALFYFAYNQQWLIVHLPTNNQLNFNEKKKLQVTKKVVKRIFWHDERWCTEETELLWSDNKAENLTHLITSWLALLDEEKVMDKKVSLQSVVLSALGQDAYCSFDRNPLNKDDATYDKLMWVEGLLKTVRENGIKIQYIQFLVHHQPLSDFHLDFSNPWPIQGFLDL